MVSDGNCESFAGLVLRHRGRSRLAQNQLASQVGVHPRSVQGWELGSNHPGAERLCALIAVFVRLGALTVGHEEAEAEGLWNAALREAPRLSVAFDRMWFRTLARGNARASVMEARAETLAEPVAFGSAQMVRLDGRAQHREDWADAPDVSECIGRVQELATLRQWVVGEHCQVVQLRGMGGIGKTTLATRLARDVASEFELIQWRSMRWTPSPSDWLAHAIAFIQGNDERVPDREDERIALLVRLLQQRRCLLVLDNLETLLLPCDCDGRFKDSFDGYRRLLQSLAERAHRSCLILTSREASADVALLTAGTVRSLELRGLSAAESQALLRDKELTASELDWADFVDRCGGNGLVLKLTAETVRQVFAGEVAAFLLAVGSNGAIHGGVRRLLASQLDERLSGIEHEVLHVLAATDEALAPATLLAELGPRVGRGAVIEALEALRRRSLIERSESGGGLSLHPLVRDYIGTQLLSELAA